MALVIHYVTVNNSDSATEKCLTKEHLRLMSSVSCVTIYSQECGCLVAEGGISKTALSTSQCKLKSIFSLN
jgi:hypothetical protein